METRFENTSQWEEFISCIYANTMEITNDIKWDTKKATTRKTSKKNKVCPERKERLHPC